MSPFEEGAQAQWHLNALALFDKSVADAKAALSNTTDAHLMKPWQLKLKRAAGSVDLWTDRG